MYRCQSETVVLPSMAASLCLSASRQTTAPRSFAENKQTCRCRKESRPAIYPVRFPNRRDSMVRQPKNSGSSCPPSPIAHKLPPARKNPPGPTTLLRSSSARWAASGHTPPHDASRIRRNSDGPRTHSNLALFRESILHWRLQVDPAPGKNHKGPPPRMESLGPPRRSPSAERIRIHSSSEMRHCEKNRRPATYPPCKPARKPLSAPDAD